MPALLLALSLLPRAAQAQQPGRGMLEGINALRQARGLPTLPWDETLGRTAEAYARGLAARGALSHRDQSGRSALQRFREQGGTSVLVGEVLGAGPGPIEVLAAWVDSPTHLEVLLDGRWTHAAAQVAPLPGGREVWVALFTRRLVEELRVRKTPQGYLVEGRLALPARVVAEPVLYSGVRLLSPEAWSGQDSFRFLVPAERGELYHRLGYRGEDGRLRITDVFFPVALLTSAPETAPR